MTRTASESRALPKAFNFVAIQSAVSAKEGVIFGETLGGDEAVEGITVVEWKPPNHVEVRSGDRHYLDAMGGGFLYGQIEEGKFELEFPGA